MSSTDSTSLPDTGKADTALVIPLSDRERRDLENVAKQMGCSPEEAASRLILEAAEQRGAQL